jgi:ATP/maltotriose-dependent transcriptional regulator MalT
MASTTREIGAPDDVDPQIAWRVVEGTLLAREGHHADALRLIEEAKELSLTADNPRLQASVLTDLAEAQRAAGNEADAETALAEAAALYEAKGDTVSRERIRQMQ